MTTLSRVASVTRKLVFIGGGLFGGILIVGIIIMIGGTLKNRFFPSPPPPPTVRYGKLPPIPFPSFPPVNNVSYIVDTISGYLPTFTDRAVVYKVNQPQTNLLSYQKAKDLAASFNYLDTPVQKSDIVFAFTKKDPFPSLLTISIDSFNFLLTSSYLDTLTPASQAAIPVGQELNAAQSFFSTANALGDSVDPSKTQTTHLLYDTSGNLIPADVPQNAQVATVDFVHSDMNNLPAVYAHPPHTNLSATVAMVNGSATVVKATKFSYDIVSDGVVTYPIKSATKAFQDLKNGNAYIALYDGKSKTIQIKNVYLAYYLPDTLTQYIMPVIVFSNDTFVAYVNAIADNWVNSNMSSVDNPQ